MTLLIINSIIITLLISCLTSISPVNLGVLILSAALSIAIRVGLVSTGWFRFITFIIYVGGILVIFAYFAALQPNQYITSWGWAFVPFLFFISLLINCPISAIKWLPFTPNTAQIYASTNLILPIFMALILFLALIIVVKTSRANEGPLRPFFYV